ncbi:MAG: folate family ECF transporter S component [Oscillospiraceae bacterium]|nr:folate family ECF transporter S component [Oscillospiraceae bacterium]
MKKWTTRQIVIDAMLSAMCAVLGYFSLDLVNVKITFESVPVLIGALLFGPIDGMTIGGIGTLIYQLLRYGVTVTTPLWILPYVLSGLIVGLYAKRKHYAMSQLQVTLIVVGSELLITLLNTFSLYVDSRIYGYYYPGIILGALALRLVICAIRGVAYSLVLPPLIKPIRTAYRRMN